MFSSVLGGGKCLVTWKKVENWTILGKSLSFHWLLVWSLVLNGSLRCQDTAAGPMVEKGYFEPPLYDVSGWDGQEDVRLARMTGAHLHSWPAVIQVHGYQSNGPLRACSRRMSWRIRRSPWKPLSHPALQRPKRSVFDRLDIINGKTSRHSILGPMLSFAVMC